MIECFITNDKINSGNNIFSRFDNVVVSKRVDKKYHYYIGNFKKKENAENFNRLVVSPMYPNSRVVNFKMGIPLNNIKGCLDLKKTRQPFKLIC
ncbi:MAG: hypothetical protein IPL95_19750 [Saprospiraceae bacterium]|nr:hypothetical protein [Saprospiraceae bacterium]